MKQKKHKSALSTSVVQKGRKKRSSSEITNQLAYPTVLQQAKHWSTPDIMLCNTPDIMLCNSELHRYLAN